MKKFLKNKGVMIGSIVAAVVMLLLVIYFCVRPVSVGFTYSGKTENLLGQEVTVKMHFDSFSKVTITEDGEDGAQLWYLEKDRYLVLADSTEFSTKEQFKEEKAKFLEGWNDQVAARYKKINAFQYKVNDTTLTAVGAIVLVSILSLIELALIGFAATSVVLNVKKK